MDAPRSQGEAVRSEGAEPRDAVVRSAPLIGQAAPGSAYPEQVGPSMGTVRSMTPKVAALLAGTAFLTLITLLSWNQYFHAHNVVVHGPTTEAQVVNQWSSTSCGRFCSKTTWAKVEFDASGTPTTAIVELSKPVSGSSVAIVYDRLDPSRVEQAGSNTGRLLISLGLSASVALLAAALGRQYGRAGQRRAG
jgi:hypothetical protein